MFVMRPISIPISIIVMIIVVGVLPGVVDAGLCGIEHGEDHAEDVGVHGPQLCFGSADVVAFFIYPSGWSIE